MKRIYTLNNLPPEASSPEFSGVNWNHYFSKAFDQLKGMCAMALNDGVVSDEEARYVQAWLKKNEPVTWVWPFKDVAKRIARIFKDGIITDEERAELHEILSEIVGGNLVPTPGNAESPLKSALTIPIPDPIVISGSYFSFTGKFATGTRDDLISMVLSLGGNYTPLPVEWTDYLVIGVFGSVNWKASSFGNKMEKAVKLRSKGGKIAIILEENLTPYLTQ